MQMIRRCIVLTTALLIFSIQAQEYYRWQDKTGQLHVSQIPPADNVDYEVVTMTAQEKEEVIAVKAKTNQTAEIPANSGASKIAQLNQQVEQMNQKVRQFNCQQAQQNKERLSSESVLMITQDDGQTVELTSEMRAEQLDVAEKQIREFCKEGAR